MSFNKFNKLWIKKVVSQKKTIFEKEAIHNMKGFYGGSFTLPTLPIPLVMEVSSYEVLCSVSTLLIDMQTKILKFLISSCSKKHILKMFNLPSSIEPYVNWKELKEGKEIIARFDIIPTQNGYKFCEINVDSSLGGIEFFDCWWLYTKSLGWFANNKVTSPQKDIASYIKKLVLEHNIERVIIFSLKRYYSQVNNTLISLSKCISDIISNISVTIVDEESFPVDLLNSNNGKRILIYRMLFYDDIKSNPLLSNIYNSGAIIINTFETEIRSNKIWFALFCDPFYQKLFSELEVSTIRDYIIPSCRLTSDNIEEFLKEKENCVFKLNRSYGGKDVLIGSEHDEETLRAKLRDVDEWLVQKHCVSEVLSLPVDETFQMKPHKVVLGLYRVFNNYSGIFVRAVTDNEVVSMSHGAKISWAFPISEEDIDALISQLNHASS